MHALYGRQDARRYRQLRDALNGQAYDRPPDHGQIKRRREPPWERGI